MAGGLSRLWARVTGRKRWDQEATSLHNVVGDETPAPGVEAAKPVAKAEEDPLTRGKAEEQMGEWRGEEPGH